mmetsp:Transcript_99930/g.149711  ORF Transcript_99930/g.149711 Transcript_99930/m.149711 type:complete len:138 (+) Transcript_99930:991-1404(+)
MNSSLLGRAKERIGGIWRLTVESFVGEWLVLDRFFLTLAAGIRARTSGGTRLRVGSSVACGLAVVVTGGAGGPRSSVARSGAGTGAGAGTGTTRLGVSTDVDLPGKVALSVETFVLIARNRCTCLARSFAPPSVKGI